MKIQQITENLNQSKRQMKMILQQCSEHFKFINEKQMWFQHHGSFPEVMGKYRTKPGRTPVDSSPAMQKNVDLILKKNGFKALRGNSLFVRPLQMMSFRPSRNSGSYGTFWIIPINGTNYTLNPNISDFYTKAYDWDENPLPMAEVRKFLAGYTQDVFQAKMANEIMLSGQFYYISMSNNTMGYSFASELLKFGAPEAAPAI